MVERTRVVEEMRRGGVNEMRILSPEKRMTREAEEKKRNGGV